jgi:hypothetical protein
VVTVRRLPLSVPIVMGLKMAKSLEIK